ERNAEFSLKVIEKKDPEENVGIFVNKNGKNAVIEYIDFPDELKKKKDKNGNLVFNAGSIGIHYISIDFIEKLNKIGFPLPYHKAIKKINSIYGEVEGIKFETFIFDAIPFAERVSCVLTDREEEFAPLKNKEGVDSPEEVKKAISNQGKKYLRYAGINVPDEILVEISPLFAIDKEEVKEKIQKIKINTKEKFIYLE
ncbi:MAG TPA: UTP--glucose-1-phosphate uridylyltransferase, partial [bacterium]|nr:UTP--glucose-1-phosphate uridylyltransferase [bacterium]